jgi:hypothetical protein
MSHVEALWYGKSRSPKSRLCTNTFPMESLFISPCGLSWTRGLKQLYRCLRLCPSCGYVVLASMLQRVLPTSAWSIG